MKVAVVHDWLTGMRGGEHVLEAILSQHPDADLFTLFHVPGSVSSAIEKHKIFTSCLQRFPRVGRWYRLLLPFYPLAVRTLNVSRYDLVISSTHAVAKGVRKGRGAVHIAYVHSPMRYIWDRFDDYFGRGRTGFLQRWVAQLIRPWLQRWDIKTSSRAAIDFCVANSQFVSQRMKRVWGREADAVIYPFVYLEKFHPLMEGQQRSGRFLVFGAMAPYKRVDLALKAFRELDLPLDVAGDGQDAQTLQRWAGPRTRFLGRLTDSQVGQVLRESEALIFPGVEDFGITPLEMMASGRPVLALAEGGVLETVTPLTGVLFQEQSVEAIKNAVRQYLGRAQNSWVLACTQRASEFSRERFCREWQRAVEVALAAAQKSR